MAIRLSTENKGSVNMELSKTALAARYAQEAKTASESAQAAAVHPPVIGGNGNWQIWNQGSGAYVDSGICAKGPAGEQGPQGEAGNYTKPAAGIPEEDLSQAVRNKLNSGGASNYADLNNKPGINGVTLSGNKTAAQLGLAAADDVPTKTSQLQNDVGFLAQHQSLAAYRTAAAQDVIDAAQNTQIAARAKADEIGIVITGNRPSMAASAGQYVIVRGSTISGVTDGVYTAVNALSPSTDVSAADLTAVSRGGLNDIPQKWTAAFTSTIAGGTLNVYVNRSLGIGIVYWQGNSDNLSAGNHDFTIPSDISPKYSAIMPMFTNDGTGYLRISGNTVRVRVSTDTAYSSCSIFYVLS